MSAVEGADTTAAIRARLSAIDENGCETCSDFALTTAIRAVLDLIDPASERATILTTGRGPERMFGEQCIREAIAAALGLTP